jgi:hypothetical protein
MLSRRNALSVLATAALALFFCRSAEGGVARAVELGELVRASERVVVVTPVESTARWETVGRQRRIVTYTRLRVDQRVSGAAGSEVWVRTLGGRVGKVGQIVHGEARLYAGEAQLVFLEPHAPGIHRIVAMAQGHYPLRAADDGKLRVVPSSELVLRGAERSAARRLAGRSLAEVEALVRTEATR